MSEPLLVRTRLIPSRLCGRLQQAAAAMTLIAAALLAWAASLQRDLMSPGFLALVAVFVLTLFSSGLLLRGLRPSTVSVEIAIPTDGTITAIEATLPARSVQRAAGQGGLQDGSTNTPQDRQRVLVPVTLTPLFVVLRGDRGRVVVWRDSLATDGFRRLSAVARWRVDRCEAGPGLPQQQT